MNEVLQAKVRYAVSLLPLFRKRLSDKVGVPMNRFYRLFIKGISIRSKLSVQILPVGSALLF